MAEDRLILCIEDESEMIDLVRIILEQHGFRVAGAIKGDDGLAFLEKEKPHLVLLDLMMPDMDGWEIYRKMKANPETSDIPVIIFTAKTDSVDKVLGLRIAKVDDYIIKPFTPDVLLQSIHRILDNGHDETSLKLKAE